MRKNDITILYTCILTQIVRVYMCRCIHMYTYTHIYIYIYIQN